MRRLGDLTKEVFHEISPYNRGVDVSESNDGREDLAETEVLRHVGEGVGRVRGFGRQLAGDLVGGGASDWL